MKEPLSIWSDCSRLQPDVSNFGPPFPAHDPHLEIWGEIGRSSPNRRGYFAAILEANTFWWVKVWGEGSERRFGVKWKPSWSRTIPVARAAVMRAFSMFWLEQRFGRILFHSQSTSVFSLKQIQEAPPLEAPEQGPWPL